MKKCPKCGNNKFYVTAHVTQDWLVDEDGDYIKTVEDCVEVTHFADSEDVWTCSKCSYEAAGSEFEKEERNNEI